MHADSLLEYARQQHRDGNLAKAESGYRAYLAAQPADAAAHCALGMLLHTQGHAQEAAACYRRAISRQPDLADAHFHLGNLQWAQGDLAAALNSYRQVLALDPQRADAHTNCAAVFQAQGDLNSALASLSQAAALAPDSAIVHYNLGVVQQALGQEIAASASWREAIRIKPDYADAYYQLGNVLRRMPGQVEAAIDSYRRAVGCDPAHSGAWNHLGLELYGQSRFEEAAHCYRRAIQTDPGDTSAHHNLAVVLLLLGRFAQAWPEHEWRLQRGDFNPYRFTQPRWNGEPMPQGTLLAWAEQGLGDTIQFARYLPLVRERVGRLIVRCRPELTTLLSGVEGVDEVVEAQVQGKLPALHFDAQVSLMSLGAVFQSEPETIPAQVPYLRADPARVEQWQEAVNSGQWTVDRKDISQCTVNFKLFTDSPEGTQRDGLKVGLVWAGNPGHYNDHNRSCGLQVFAPLASVPGVTLFSLQKGEAAQQATSPPPGMRIVRLSDGFADLADTAAAILNLDVVIGVDTAIVHLAGALGKPVWTLLPFLPDWRWMLDRRDCPWYPTMRLFRQPRPGDWQAVIEQIAKELPA